MKITQSEFESKIIEMDYCIRNSMISEDEAIVHIFDGERPIAFVSLSYYDDYFIEPVYSGNKELLSLITSYAKTSIEERQYDEILQEWRNQTCKIDRFI